MPDFTQNSLTHRFQHGINDRAAAYPAAARLSRHAVELTAIHSNSRALQSWGPCTDLSRRPRAAVLAATNLVGTCACGVIRARHNDFSDVCRWNPPSCHQRTTTTWLLRVVVVSVILKEWPISHIILTQPQFPLASPTLSSTGRVSVDAANPEGFAG